MKKNYGFELSDYYMKGVFGKYTQFTVDFVDREVNREDFTADKLLALDYKIELVLSIMRTDIPDYEFFTKLREYTEKETNAILDEEKFIGKALRLMSGQEGEEQ